MKRKSLVILVLAVLGIGAALYGAYKVFSYYVIYQKVKGVQKKVTGNILARRLEHARQVQEAQLRDFDMLVGMLEDEKKKTGEHFKESVEQAERRLHATVLKKIEELAQEERKERQAQGKRQRDEQIELLGEYLELLQTRLTATYDEMRKEVGEELEEKFDYLRISYATKNKEYLLQMKRANEEMLAQQQVEAKKQMAQAQKQLELFDKKVSTTIETVQKQAKAEFAQFARKDKNRARLFNRHLTTKKRSLQAELRKDHALLVTSMTKKHAALQKTLETTMGKKQRAFEKAWRQKQEKLARQSIDKLIKDFDVVQNKLKVDANKTFHALTAKVKRARDLDQEKRKKEFAKLSHQYSTMLEKKLADVKNDVSRQAQTRLHALFQKQEKLRANDKKSLTNKYIALLQNKMSEAEKRLHNEIRSRQNDLATALRKKNELLAKQRMEELVKKFELEQKVLARNAEKHVKVLVEQTAKGQQSAMAVYKKQFEKKLLTAQDEIRKQAKEQLDKKYLSLFESKLAAVQDNVAKQMDSSFRTLAQKTAAVQDGAAKQFQALAQKTAAVQDSTVKRLDSNFKKFAQKYDERNKQVLAAQKKMVNEAVLAQMKQIEGKFADVEKNLQDSATNYLKVLAKGSDARLADQEKKHNRFIAEQLLTVRNRVRKNIEKKLQAAIEKEQELGLRKYHFLTKKQLALFGERVDKLYKEAEKKSTKRLQSLTAQEVAKKIGEEIKLVEGKVQKAFDESVGKAGQRMEQEYAQKFEKFAQASTKQQQLEKEKQRVEIDALASNMLNLIEARFAMPKVPTVAFPGAVVPAMAFKEGEQNDKSETAEITEEVKVPGTPITILVKKPQQKQEAVPQKPVVQASDETTKEFKKLLKKMKKMSKKNSEQLQALTQRLGMMQTRQMAPNASLGDEGGKITQGEVDMIIKQEVQKQLSSLRGRKDPRLARLKKVVALEKMRRLVRGLMSGDQYGQAIEF